MLGVAKKRSTSEMASSPKTGLLAPHERLRVKPAVFEDFTRRPALEAEPAPEPLAAEPLSGSHLEPPASSLLSDEELLPAEWDATSAADQAEWERELQAAYERGFEDGKIAAGSLYEVEFRRYQQWLQRFDELARTLRLQLHELSQELERAALRLAFVLAEHILRSELRQHPEQLEQLLRRALAALPAEARGVRIRLHPDTLEALQRAGSRIAAGLEEDITLVADPSVEPAGCILESPWGSVDAQLHEQLQNLREQLEW